MRRKIWMQSPDAGGTTIPSGVREETERRIREYAEKRYGGMFSRLGVRFHGALFGGRRIWSMAFYTYSNERYELCTFPNGTFYGTPEEALEVGAAYLRARSAAPGPPPR